MTLRMRGIQTPPPKAGVPSVDRPIAALHGAWEMSYGGFWFRFSHPVRLRAPGICNPRDSGDGACDAAPCINQSFVNRAIAVTAATISAQAQIVALSVAADAIKSEKRWHIVVGCSLQQLTRQPTCHLSLRTIHPGVAVDMRGPGARMSRPHILTKTRMRTGRPRFRHSWLYSFPPQTL